MAQPPWKAWPPITGGGPFPGGRVFTPVGILSTDGMGLVFATPLDDGVTPFAKLSHPATGHYVLTFTAPPALNYVLFCQNLDPAVFADVRVSPQSTMVFDIFLTTNANAAVNAGFSVQAWDVAKVVPAAGGPFLLDNLSVQPLWAHSLGVQLRSEQAAAFRVRRASDNAELDIGFVAGVADVAALAAFCVGTNGFVVKAYNAVEASPYPDVSAIVGEQAKIFDSVTGVVLGATGFAAARFDPVASDGRYRRADALGLVGDPALTVVGDLNGVAASYVARLGDTSLFTPHMVGLWTYSNQNPTQIEVDIGLNGTAGFQVQGRGTAVPGFWFQFSKALNCGDLSAATYPMFGNGVQATDDLGGAPATLALTNVGFEWSDEVSDDNTPQLRAAVLVFNANLPVDFAADQALVNAWFTAHHA